MSRRLFAFAFAAACVCAAAADWPQWRGPQRAGIAREAGLLQEWPAGGPPLRWRADDIGTGYSSPAVSAGRVYLQTTRGDDEFALALDERTGKEVWSAPVGKVGRNTGPQYPGTRATPTLDGDRLYCLASDGELVCLTADGKPRWRKSLPRDFGGKVGPWAYSESVLVDGAAVVCTPGGESAALLKLDKMTGDVVWKSALPGGDTADYASVVVMTVGGARQYVQFLRRGAAGVDADTGRFLWRYERANDPGANMLTPVVDGDRVFIAGSRTGGALLHLFLEGDSVKPREVYFDPTLAPSIGGAVLDGGRLYGSAGQTLFCAEFATGKTHWKDRSVGPSSVCLADGRLYARGHTTGEVALVELTPAGYSERGRLKPPTRGQTPAWPHPVVSNGGLYLRDQGVLLCYDVAKK